MAAFIEFSKIGICLFFNTAYLLSSGYFVFVWLMLSVGQSQLTAVQLGSTLSMALPLTAIAALVVIVVSIYGFYALAFNDKAGPVRKYALLILASLVLQSTVLAVVYYRGNELTRKLIKYDVLPKFERNIDNLWFVIQETQQSLNCCAVDEYKDYFGAKSGLTPDEQKALIPNSCCGRYRENDWLNHSMGGCVFEEFSKRNGCGDHLVRAYNHVYGGYNYGFGYANSRFGLIIYDAVGLCLILANRMSYLRA